MCQVDWERLKAFERTISDGRTPSEDITLIAPFGVENDDRGFVIGALIEESNSEVRKKGWFANPRCSCNNNSRQNFGVLKTVTLKSTESCVVKILVSLSNVRSAVCTTGKMVLSGADILSKASMLALVIRSRLSEGQCVLRGWRERKLYFIEVPSTVFIDTAKVTDYLTSCK